MLKIFKGFAKLLLIKPQTLSEHPESYTVPARKPLKGIEEESIKYIQTISHVKWDCKYHNSICNQIQAKNNIRKDSKEYCP